MQPGKAVQYNFNINTINSFTAYTEYIDTKLIMQLLTGYLWRDI